MPYRDAGLDRRSRFNHVIPCPNETRGRTCVECRLCLDDEALRRRGQVIAFGAHGRDADEARVRLPVIRGDA